MSRCLVYQQICVLVCAPKSDLKTGIPFIGSNGFLHEYEHKSKQKEVGSGSLYSSSAKVMKASLPQGADVNIVTLMIKSDIQIVILNMPKGFSTPSRYVLSEKLTLTFSASKAVCMKCLGHC